MDKQIINFKNLKMTRKYKYIKAVNFRNENGIKLDNRFIRCSPEKYRATSLFLDARNYDFKKRVKSLSEAGYEKGKKSGYIQEMKLN